MRKPPRTHYQDRDLLFPPLTPQDDRWLEYYESFASDAECIIATWGHLWQSQWQREYIEMFLEWRDRRRERLEPSFLIKLAEEIALNPLLFGPVIDQALELTYEARKSEGAKAKDRSE